MEESVFPQPTPEQLTAFVNGDPVVINDVMAALLPPFYRWAKQRYPDLPQDEVHSSIHQALAEVCCHYSRYDPNKAQFTSYLIELIRLRLLDLQAKHTKITSNEEIGDDSYEKLLKLPYNSLETDIQRRVDLKAFLVELRSELTELEAAFLELLLRGNTAPADFAALITRHDPSSNDAISEAKNLRARLIRKMRREAQKRGYSLEDFT